MRGSSDVPTRGRSADMADALVRVIECTERVRCCGWRCESDGVGCCWQRWVRRPWDEPRCAWRCRKTGPRPAATDSSACRTPVQRRLRSPAQRRMRECAIATSSRAIHLGSTSTIRSTYGSTAQRIEFPRDDHSNVRFANKFVRIGRVSSAVPTTRCIGRPRHRARTARSKSDVQAA
jgi:hypothetical protein